MRPGLMRHKLIFQTRSETSDGMGAGGTVTWTDTVTTRAARLNVSASERIEAARTKQNSISKWRVRYRSDITPDMRIKWVRGSTTKYLEILSINPVDMLNRELEVITEDKT